MKSVESSICGVVEKKKNQPIEIDVLRTTVNVDGCPASEPIISLIPILAVVSIVENCSEN